MSRNLIGIDVGTTSIKVIAVNTEGEVTYTNSADHDLLSPQVGYAEEDTEVWVEHTLNLLRELVGSIDPTTIGAIGITGMVPTLIMLDEANRPLMHSIQQNDVRAHQQIEQLAGEVDPEWFFTETGNRINQQHIFPKLRWIETTRPDVFARATHIVGSYNYLAYRLTNVLSLERNWALESGMWSLRKDRWIPEILELAHITPEMLPAVYSATDVIGGTTADIQERTGIVEGTPVIAGSADHVASAFSSGGKRAGDLVIKLGGAGDILLTTDAPVTDDRLFIDYHCADQQLYFLNGCTATSGSMLKWFQEQWGADSYDELDIRAAEVGVGSEGLVILPYFLGEKTPIFDVNARGVIYGLTLSHTKYEIYHAALEAVAFSLYHHVEVFLERNLSVDNVYITNGGSKSPLWRQIMADVLGYNLEYVRNHPGSSLGAAILGGIGVDLVSEEMVGVFLQDRVMTAFDSGRHQRYVEVFALYKEVYAKLKGTFRRKR